MKTLIRPGALLSNMVKTKVARNNDMHPTQKDKYVREVGVFASHRDVLVAIEELLEAGFSLDGIALVARQARRNFAGVRPVVLKDTPSDKFTEQEAKHHDWQEDFTIYDNFNVELFGLNEIDRYFFLRLFERGKYLLLVTGTEQDLKSIGAIIGRRRGHGEVWYF